MTLTAPLRRAAGPGARATFLFWYDTEPRYDTAALESSADGVTWAPLPATLRAGRETFTGDGTFTGYGGRHWWLATAEVPPGTTRLRLGYRTDAASQGRGVLLDRLRVFEPGAILVDGTTRFEADGWNQSDN
jgi:hypothetical protein